MDAFSVVILERTMESVSELMQPGDNPHVEKCVNVIQRYIDWPDPDSKKEFRTALIELAVIAHECGQFAIATRLSAFARRLGEAGRSDVA